MASDQLHLHENGVPRVVQGVRLELQTHGLWWVASYFDGSNTAWRCTNWPANPSPEQVDRLYEDAARTARVRYDERKSRERAFEVRSAAPAVAVADRQGVRGRPVPGPAPRGVRVVRRDDRAQGSSGSEQPGVLHAVLPWHQPFESGGVAGAPRTPCVESGLGSQESYSSDSCSDSGSSSSD